MGNIYVRSYEIWIGGSGGDVVLKKKLTDRRTKEDGRRPITIAFSSGQLETDSPNQHIY